MCIRDRGYEVASIHLENSYNDWCASIMAKKMGKEKDADFFLKRSMTYRNIYDKQCGFFRPRMSDGSWAEPFDPFRYDGCLLYTSYIKLYLTYFLFPVKSSSINRDISITLNIQTFQIFYRRTCRIKDRNKYCFFLIVVGINVN